MATMGAEARNLASAVDREDVVEKLLQEGTLQAISNTIWALATLGIEARNFASAVDRKYIVQKIVQEGKPQDIANTIWAMATMGAEARNLASAVDRKDVVQKLVERGKLQDICNVLWSLATMGVEARNLASAADREDVVQKLVREGTPQVISTTIWALATMGAEVRNLASVVNRKEVVQKLVKEGKPQDISNTVWAMASMKVECPGLINGIEGEAERIMRNGDIQHISNIAYALADLGYFEKRVFDAVAGQVERVAREGNQQHLCNILWSLAVARRIKENERSVEVLWKEVNKRDVDSFVQKGLRQLKLTTLFASCEGVKLKAGEGHQQKMDETALHASADGTGEFEENIAKELVRFGFTGFRREISPFAGEEGGELLKIDMAFEKEQVALELDGPSHFLKSMEEKGDGEEPRRDGQTSAKSRLMESLGWQVFRHGYLSDRKLNKMPEEKRREFWVKNLGELGVKPSE